MISVKFLINIDIDFKIISYARLIKIILLTYYHINGEIINGNNKKEVNNNIYKKPIFLEWTPYSPLIFQSPFDLDFF